MAGAAKSRAARMATWRMGFAPVMGRREPDTDATSHARLSATVPGPTWCRDVADRPSSAAHRIWRRRGWVDDAGRAVVDPRQRLPLQVERRNADRLADVWARRPLHASGAELDAERGPDDQDLHHA